MAQIYPGNTWAPPESRRESRLTDNYRWRVARARLHLDVTVVGGPAEARLAGGLVYVVYNVHGRPI